LREPLETGTVAIARVGLRAEYPARFQLVAAMNPCPCGYFETQVRACRCRPQDVARYRARLSGPLLDRIDLRVSLQAIAGKAAEAINPSTLSSADMVSRQARIQERVAAARVLQLRRQGKPNALLAAKDIEAMGISLKARAAIQQIAAKRALSLRAQHRMLRVARTLADLHSPESTCPIEHGQVGEALQLRQALETD